MESRPHCEVLSIRDNPADERLINEVWGQDPQIAVSNVRNGIEALEILRVPGRKLPNLILLGGSFPVGEMTAVEIVSALKADEALRCIPVVVLTDRLSPTDTYKLYDVFVSCVIELPTTFLEFEKTLGMIKDLWLGIACLPYRAGKVYPDREI